MVLSDLEIVKAKDQGTIIIEPFNRANVNPSSYDVRLGEWFYRETETLLPVYNIYDSEHVQRVWGGAQCAMTYAQLIEREELPRDLCNLAADDQVIPLRPGETILAHTQEYIGGVKDISTAMQARSSMGRNFIEVCKCAGWIDCGYANRVTMEITNNSRWHTIPLVVGRRIAQIVFLETPNVGENYRGKYQPYAPNESASRWQPSDMLPKLYQDYELQVKADA